VFINHLYNDIISLLRKCIKFYNYIYCSPINLQVASLKSSRFSPLFDLHAHFFHLLIGIVKIVLKAFKTFVFLHL